MQPPAEAAAAALRGTEAGARSIGKVQATLIGGVGSAGTRIRAIQRTPPVGESGVGQRSRGQKRLAPSATQFDRHSSCERTDPGKDEVRRNLEKSVGEEEDSAAKSVRGGSEAWTEREVCDARSVFRVRAEGNRGGMRASGQHACTPTGWVYRHHRRAPKSAFSCSAANERLLLRQIRSSASAAFKNGVSSLLALPFTCV